MVHRTSVSKGVLCTGVENISHRGGNEFLSPLVSIPDLYLIMNSIRGLHVKGICPKIQGTKESNTNFNANRNTVSMNNCNRKAILKRGQPDGVFGIANMETTWEGLCFQIAHGRRVPILQP